MQPAALVINSKAADRQRTWRDWKNERKESLGEETAEQEPKYMKTLAFNLLAQSGWLLLYLNISDDVKIHLVVPFLI